MKYILLYCTLLVCSCSPGTGDIVKVYKSRGAIVNLFTDKSVFRSRGQNIIMYYTHKDPKTNRYFFEIVNKQCRFSNDSIEYTPDIMQLKNERRTEAYKQELIWHVKKLLDKMDELNIRDFRGDWSGAGVDLKIYMKSGGVILYNSNPKKTKGPLFSDYIKSMEKLDDNWYYSLKDK